jgi:spermidine synthase
MTARALTASRSIAGTTLSFALPIGLSAFLLFSVEPLVGRLVLPVFGGTPAVWTTTLFFFQAVLLVGYLYGHVSVTRLGRAGPPLHLVLAGLGFVALIVSPGRIGDLRIEALSPSLDLLRILFVLIGLPALVLTTTTPLVSGWFEATRSRRDGGDPYWLYALSNGGSLLALLAYPLVIEPRLGLATQRGLWAVGYAGLVVLLAVAGTRVMPALVARGQAAGAADSVGIGAVAAKVPAIAWPRRLRWLLLAAIPSGLLSAVTTFIATDLASAPLLWVMPLAIYLASFIVAFSPRGGRLIGLAVLAAPAMITLMWVPYGSAGGWPILAILVMELVAFAVVAVSIHGRLAQDRPDPAHLTEFYLILSLGGALASAFVALVAPQVFPNVWEYPILLVGALVALALVAPPVVARPTAGGLDFSPFFTGFRARFLPYAVGAAVLTAALLITGSPVTELGVRWLIVGGLILAVGARPWFLVIATALVLGLATFVLQPPVEFRARSFFGVTEVLHPAGSSVATLMNGTTVHGKQYTDPARRRIPGTYYGKAGPAGDIFAIGTDRPGASAAAPTRIGVVGLGAGTLAAYVNETMAMTYFEIDPVVIEVAEDPTLFTYLADAPTAPRIVMGDARLSLADEPDAAFDLVVLDAFSSDAIPVHLLTVEAITDELRTLAPGGIVAFHISNRYYDLAPPIAAALQRLGMVTLDRASSPPAASKDSTDSPSRWLVASRDPARLAAFEALGWRTAAPADHPFTDDYADLLTYLRLGF